MSKHDFTGRTCIPDETCSILSSHTDCSFLRFTIKRPSVKGFVDIVYSYTQCQTLVELVVHVASCKTTIRPHSAALVCTMIFAYGHLRLPRSKWFQSRNQTQKWCQWFHARGSILNHKTIQTYRQLKRVPRLRIISQNDVIGFTGVPSLLSQQMYFSPKAPPKMKEKSVSVSAETISFRVFDRSFLTVRCQDNRIGFCFFSV